jgi:hypothetical protein
MTLPNLLMSGQKDTPNRLSTIVREAFETRGLSLRFEGPSEGGHWDRQ